MDQVNWAEFFHAVTGLITAITAIMVPLTTYWLKKMLDKQNKEIATIKNQTNGVMDAIREDSRAAGKLEGKVEGRADAKREAAVIASIVAEETVNKLAPVAAEKIVEKILTDPSTQITATKSS